jgi:hypothetical protein
MTDLILAFGPYKSWTIHWFFFTPRRLERDIVSVSRYRRFFKNIYQHPAETMTATLILILINIRSFFFSTTAQTCKSTQQSKEIKCTNVHQFNQWRYARKIVFGFNTLYQCSTSVFTYICTSSMVSKKKILDILNVLFLTI